MQPFIVPLNGLSAGTTQYSFKAEGKFFGDFDNSEILDADLDVAVSVEKSGRYIGVDVDIDGTVTVPCDRCLSDLVLDVSAHPRFSVKFGPEPSDAPDELVEGEREIIYLPDTDAELDLAQTVYDYTCISLPICRTHPDGECDPETVRYLSSEESIGSGEESGQDVTESPFAALKALLDDNK